MANNAEVQRKVGKAMAKVSQAMKRMNMHQGTWDDDSSDSSSDDDNDHNNTPIHVKTGRNGVTFRDGKGANIKVKNVGTLVVGNNNTLTINKSAPVGFSKEERREEYLIKKPTLNPQQRIVLENQTPATERDFRIAAKFIGKTWRKFCRNLELDDATIEQIQQGYHSSGIREVTFQCMCRWKEMKSDSATIGKLAKAAYDANCDIGLLEQFPPS